MNRIRRMLAILLIFVTLIGCMQICSSAASVEPRYTNTMLAQTNLSFIDDVAHVLVSYECYEPTGNTVKITTTLQKRFLLFWWTDLETWTDASTTSNNIIVHTYATSSGTHRVLAKYEIFNVNTGATDVIEHEVEGKN